MTMFIFERRETMNNKKQINSKKQNVRIMLQKMYDHESNIIRLRLCETFLMRFFDSRENNDDHKIQMIINEIIENEMIKKMQIEHALFLIHQNFNFRLCVLNNETTTTRRTTQQLKRRKQNA